MLRNDNDYFNLSDFTYKGELRTPTALVLVLVFLSRYPVILLMSGFSSLMLKRRGVSFEGFGLLPVDGMLSSLPAIGLLVVVLFRERLKSRQWSLMVLQHGVKIILLVAIVQFAIDARFFWQLGQDTPVWIVIEGICSLYCAIYILRSRKAANWFQVYSKPQEEPPEG